MPQPTEQSKLETARLKQIFQEMHDPAEIQGVRFSGMTPQQVQAMLPEYNQSAHNPMYGILVDGETGKAYGFQSGQNFGAATHCGLAFRRGTLSCIDIETTTINFLTQEAHIEAQVSGFMRKQGIETACLFINGSTPCLGEFGCNQNLPFMLPPGSRLRVFGTASHGSYQGLPD